MPPRPQTPPQPLPATLREFFLDFDRYLDDSQREMLRQTPGSPKGWWHFTYGLFIRNRYLYPRRSPIPEAMKEVRCGDPEYVCGLLVDLFQAHLNGEVIDRALVEAKIREHFERPGYGVPPVIDPEWLDRLIG